MILNVEVRVKPKGKRVPPTFRKRRDSMKNIAEFPNARKNIELLFEIWKRLDGNAESFEPMAEGNANVYVVKAVERDSAKGNPMKEIVWQDIDSGREATTYTMKRGKDDKPFFDYTPIKVGDQLQVSHKVNNGFSSIKILRECEEKIESLPNRPRKFSKGCIKQTLYVFDIEVFKHDILIMGKDYFTGEWFEFNNDLQGFRKFYLENRDSLFVGYNNSGYDNHVVRGYLQGKNPYMISKVIIDGDNRQSVYKTYNTRKTTFFSMDLYQDNRGFSLKEHSGFMGIDIRETEVDFDLDRPLTDEEKEKNKFYCKNDVEATVKRMEQNSSMLLAKMAITGMFDLDKTAIGMTNANLTGLLLKAVKTADRKDEKDPYELPESLIIETPDVLNTYVGREFPLNEKGNADIALDVPRRDLVEVMGVGGIHGAKESYIRIGEFFFRDVGSLYPNTMVIFDHLSRNIPKEEQHVYIDLLDKRMEAKYSGEKYTSVKGVSIPTKSLITGIKLPLNTKYGAMGAEFNVLFDKRMRLHVCITGQLAMFDLLEKIEPHATIIQSNTDAHAFIPFSEADAEAIEVICKEWAERTGYTLDNDVFKAIYQKDVNNYLAVDENNHPKIKGAIGLTGGLKVSKAIVSNAFINYVLGDKDFNEFIDECNELRQFQIITKTGWTFDETIYIDSFNTEHSANKVNRVFATKDPLKSVEIYKVKENTFTCEADVREHYGLTQGEILESTPKQIATNEAKVELKISQYNENKNESGEWYERSYTQGVPNAPQYYQISNEAVGQGITIEEIDKDYYKSQVVDLLVLWFGDNWEERIKEAHSNPEFEPLPVINYID